MDREEAEKLLKVLSDHYGEPVMPVRRYCDALRTWGTALSDRARRSRDAIFVGLSRDEIVTKRGDLARRSMMTGKKTSEDHAYDELKSQEKIAEAAYEVFRQITKSNLLARLIYGGQALRTTPCPTHKGRWSGCMWPKDSKDVCACMVGSNVTGWLPNAPPEEGKTP